MPKNVVIDAETLDTMVKLLRMVLTPEVLNTINIEPKNFTTSEALKLIQYVREY